MWKITQFTVLSRKHLKNNRILGLGVNAVHVYRGILLFSECFIKVLIIVWITLLLRSISSQVYLVKHFLCSTYNYRRKKQMCDIFQRYCHLLIGFFMVNIQLLLIHVFSPSYCNEEKPISSTFRCVYLIATDKFVLKK